VTLFLRQRSKRAGLQNQQCRLKLRVNSLRQQIIDIRTVWMVRIGAAL
jgi:hypothetical protein